MRPKATVWLVLYGSTNPDTHLVEVYKISRDWYTSSSGISGDWYTATGASINTSSVRMFVDIKFLNCCCPSSIVRLLLGCISYCDTTPMSNWYTTRPLSGLIVYHSLSLYHIWYTTQNDLTIGSVGVYKSFQPASNSLWELNQDLLIITLMLHWLC